jgi:hypothetical protein
LDVRTQPEVGYPRVSTRGQVKTGASIPYQDREIRLILIFEGGSAYLYRLDGTPNQTRPLLTVIPRG